MYRGIIQSDPLIMMDKPVIAGTRITVELIVEKLAGGETVEQILEAHARLNAGGHSGRPGFCSGGVAC